MPDHPAFPRSVAPPDWHHAFAALPLEAPPADGWQRIAAALPRTPRRRRHLLPWAVAAATACLAALPALQLLRAPAPVEVAQPAPAGATQAIPHADGASASASLRTDAGDGGFAAAPVAAHAEPVPVQPVPAAAMAEPGLEPLQAESARLEGLLAELSADAGGGMQLALSASLRTQVAGIDDALAGTDLDDDARSGLWRQRVELLRALAGLAAEQRWQALYGGNGADYALVQVH